MSNRDHRAVAFPEPAGDQIAGPDPAKRVAHARRLAVVEGNREEIGLPALHKPPAVAAVETQRRRGAERYYRRRGGGRRFPVERGSIDNRLRVSSVRVAVRTAGRSAEGPNMSKASDPKQQTGEKIRQEEKLVASDRISEEALDKVAGGATVIGRSAKETK
jgi:hypothetical protein